MYGVLRRLCLHHIHIICRHFCQNANLKHNTGLVGEEITTFCRNRESNAENHELYHEYLKIDNYISNNFIEQTNMIVEDKSYIGKLPTHNETSLKHTYRSCD